MGNMGAQRAGMEKAPTTTEEAAEKMIATIDGATREDTSGRFISVIEGTELPW
ncbi:hypothetical protein BO71DRAFT_489652 [Aspergillus ellipticus CBS 707.79]|uniref:Uncharacterized protein n=1 Tax=Aspergillus ellipticus CBS 707.79 TaxID=1448320 RepID=A0A319D8J5_9EURO|nr:hypothetical protein BO71DRAFT_489652 [Aspergillus ellipticus CBS 707.79]